LFFLCSFGNRFFASFPIQTNLNKNIVCIVRLFFKYVLYLGTKINFYLRNWFFVLQEICLLKMRYKNELYVYFLMLNMSFKVACWIKYQEKTYSITMTLNKIAEKWCQECHQIPNLLPFYWCFTTKGATDCHF
jgi:hypothetical protein